MPLPKNLQYGRGKPLPYRLKAPSEPEVVRQKLGQLIADVTVSRFGAEDLHIRGEFRQELTAGSAGRAPVFAVRVDGYAAKLPVSLADRLAAGGTLGTDGAAEGRVFHIAAGKDRAVGTFQCRADSKA